MNQTVFWDKQASQLLQVLDSEVHILDNPALLIITVIGIMLETLIWADFDKCHPIAIVHFYL